MDKSKYILTDEQRNDPKFMKKIIGEDYTNMYELGSKLKLNPEFMQELLKYVLLDVQQQLNIYIENYQFIMIFYYQNLNKILIYYFKSLMRYARALKIMHTIKIQKSVIDY